jgi:hypothetical protein
VAHSIGWVLVVSRMLMPRAVIYVGFASGRYMRYDWTVIHVYARYDLL